MYYSSSTAGTAVVNLQCLNVCCIERNYHNVPFGVRVIVIAVICKLGVICNVDICLSEESEFSAICGLFLFV